MKINHFLPFFPAKDFVESRNFYVDLGFEVVWEDNDLVRFRAGNTEFFLQNDYVKEFAENLIIHLNIDEFQETYQKFKLVVEKYKTTKIVEPKQEFYGLAFKMRGPSGEIWDVVEGIQEEDLEA